MSRVVQFLTGITVASAASAVVNCDAPTATGRTCSSCVGTAAAQACVNYTAPPPPTCASTCGNGGLSGPVANCSVATASATASTACVICAPALGGVLGLGVCITTNFGIAPYLAAQSTWDAALDLSAFVKGQAATTITNIDATTAAANASISGNVVVVLNAAAATTAIAAVTADATANAIFQVNASTHVNSWNSGASAKVNNNNGGALVVDQLSVNGGSSSKFSVWQNTGASVTLNSISFSASMGNNNGGTVQVVGGTAHFGASGSASANITGSGTVQLGGGVSVDGNVPQTVTIDVSGSGASNAPVATIDAGTTLSTSGDVTTSTSNGAISVNGNFILGSTSANVDPKVILNSGASFVVNSSAQLHAKAVDIYAGAKLVIRKSANRTAPLINKITKCVGTVQITLDVTAAVFIAANNAGSSVGLYYDSSNNVQDLKQCAVEVWDSAGTKFTLTSTTSASAGRRLLASDGTAQWNSDSMTFQMDKSTPSSPSSASVSFAVIPVLMVSLAGLLL